MPEIDPVPVIIRIVGPSEKEGQEVFLLQKEIATNFQYKAKLFTPYESSEPMPPETGGGGEERLYELILVAFSGGFVGSVSTNLVEILFKFLERNKSYKMTLRRGDMEFSIEGIHPDKAIEYARQLFPDEFDLPDPDAG